jgi:hypothetical protein
MELKKGSVKILSEERRLDTFSQTYVKMYFSDILFTCW